MMDFLLQRQCELAHVQLVLETYYRLADKRGPEPFVVGADFDAVAYEGDFALKVSVYQDEADEAAVARFLARTLHTKVVVTDDALNPYTWIIVNEQGLARPIHEEPGHPQGFFVVDQKHRGLLAPCRAAPTFETSNPI